MVTGSVSPGRAFGGFSSVTSTRLSTGFTLTHAVAATVEGLPRSVWPFGVAAAPGTRPRIRMKWTGSFGA